MIILRENTRNRQNVLSHAECILIWLACIACLYLQIDRCLPQFAHDPTKLYFELRFIALAYQLILPLYFIYKFIIHYYTIVIIVLQQHENFHICVVWFLQFNEFTMHNRNVIASNGFQIDRLLMYNNYYYHIHGKAYVYTMCKFNHTKQ